VSQAPTDETTLEHYPWIVVRFRCTRCRRYGDSRLARLAEKFGATETIAALISRFTRPVRTGRGAEAAASS
jgi:hypothetical protein